MTLHHMRLHSDPFEKMESGQKDFEIRLNDEKRQEIAVGDEIEFAKRPEGEQKVTRKVIGLKSYQSFADLWRGVKHYYPDRSEESFIKAMYDYYSTEEEKKYGALVIELEPVR